MGLKRRTFLQQAGLALAALGVTETGLSLLADKSLALPLPGLAQPSARKLALLIGINQYANTTALNGCVTDVELQRELLIYRFGFKPSDILTLTDKDATRQNIETAFLEHLTNQAAVGDVVVFHFSGYGSRIASIKEGNSFYENSLVPVDGLLPIQGNYLLEDTLLLLLRSLPTEKVTTILDTSYIDGGTPLQGNLRVRSHPSISAEQLSAEELAFREELLVRLNSTKIQQRGQQTPGIVLAASQLNQLATESVWGGFSAGTFTYNLTQNLWQATPPNTIHFILSKSASAIAQLVGKEQQPQLLSSQKTKQQSLTPYNLPLDSSMAADGVVIGVEESGKIQIWLAGLPVKVLGYYAVNSLLTVVTPSDISVTTKPVQVQIRAREGLIAKARIVGNPENYTPQIGQLVQESMRILPRNIGLTIALDPRLERIERVDATSAFANITCVSSVVAAAEQPADYLFSKLQQTKADKEKSTQDIGGGYGLFYLDGDRIPHTDGEAGEAVKVAIKRLVPKLRTLAASKLLQLTGNEGSSLLGVKATLEILTPTPQIIMQRETVRRQQANSQKILPNSENIIPTLPIGSRIQYSIQNYSDRPVYLMALGVDSSGNAIAFYPLQSDTPETKPTLKDILIPAGESITIPRTPTALELVVQGTAGLAENYLICSSAPFTQTLATLEIAKRIQVERVAELFNPLDVARSLLQDLHQASAMISGKSTSSTTDSSSASSDTYMLDVNSWATLSFIYQLV